MNVIIELKNSDKYEVVNIITERYEYNAGLIKSESDFLKKLKQKIMEYLRNNENNKDKIIISYINSKLLLDRIEIYLNKIEDAHK
ncbi:MAG: hypothetical protein N3F62_02455 [Bacteroidia bacterium]|nr:hypothetical protein [Bacteroidia bacterium]